MSSELGQESTRDVHFITPSPPVNLRAFFSRSSQSVTRLTSGHRIRTPLFFWGPGVLGLTGTVLLGRAAPFLSKLGKIPLLVPTSKGPAALAAIMSPAYAGSSAGPYCSFFFGFFVQHPGWDSAHPRPGFQFVDFYDNTVLSTTAGQLWQINKKLARVESHYDERQRTAAVTLDERTMVRLSWRQPGARRSPVVERRFINFPEAGTPGARILVCGAESSAPFRLGLDEYYHDSDTPLGALITQMAFAPHLWTFTHAAHGIYFLPDERPGHLA